MDVKALAAELPISAVLDDIEAALAASDSLVLQAEPGAGKTTIVPLLLLQQSWLNGDKIIVLEPRRMAARAAAERMAELLGEPAGQTVGYRMRMDTRVSERTRIEVVTEGVFTRMLQADPSLDGVGAVLFDEFHERSIDADFGLALTLQARDYFRDSPLKLIVMSATLEKGRVAELLGDAPVVQCAGRSYPVEIVHGDYTADRHTVVDDVVHCTLKAIKEVEGSVLVFLPGQREIDRVAGLLKERLAALGLPGVSNCAAVWQSQFAGAAQCDCSRSWW